VASGADLLLYSVNNITSGTDAQGEVTVRLAKDGRVVNGQGADTDIVVASAKAYLHALISWIPIGAGASAGVTHSGQENGTAANACKQSDYPPRQPHKSVKIHIVISS